MLICITNNCHNVYFSIQKIYLAENKRVIPSLGKVGFSLETKNKKPITLKIPVF